METARTWIERSYADATERMLVGQPGAAEGLRRVAAVDPDFAPAHAGLALLHHRAGRVESAWRRLERAGGGGVRRHQPRAEPRAGSGGADRGAPQPGPQAHRWPTCGRTWPCAHRTPCWCRRGPSS